MASVMSTQFCHCNANTAVENMQVNGYGYGYLNLIVRLYLQNSKWVGFSLQAIVCLSLMHQQNKERKDYTRNHPKKDIEKKKNKNKLTRNMQYLYEEK